MADPRTRYAHSPPERNSGEIFGRNLKETDEKSGEILAKFSIYFRPSISREIGHKKFQTNSSTHQDLEFHTAEPKFFLSDTLGVGGPKKLRDLIRSQGEVLQWQTVISGCDGNRYRLRSSCDFGAENPFILRNSSDLALGSPIASELRLQFLVH